MKKQNLNLLNEYQRLTYLQNLLLNQLSFLSNQNKRHTQEQFKSDLILVLDLQQFKKSNQIIQTPLNLKQLINKPNPLLTKAYKRCLEKIQSQTKNRKNLEKSYFFKIPFRKNQKQKELYIYQSQCPNLFILYLNTILYTLNVQCNFVIKTYIVKDKLFILLYMPTETLWNQAAQLKIKKEIVYKQIDQVLSEPIDNKFRFLRDNQIFQEDEQIQQFQQKLKVIFKKYIFKSNNFKTKTRNYLNKIDHDAERWLQRKMDCLLPESEKCQQQCILSSKVILRYKNYLQELVDNLQNKILYANHFTASECNYLKLLPCKYSQKSEHIFQDLLRKNKFFEYKKELMKKNQLDYIETPKVFAQFILPKKNKKYKEKITDLLLFKPNIVGINKQLDLFFKMERTKICYFTLMKYINTDALNINILNLHDQFQKSGRQIKEVFNHQKEQLSENKFIADVRQIQLQQNFNRTQTIQKNVKQKIDNQQNNKILIGGLDGQYLQSGWDIYKPWGCNIKIIKDYLGQNYAFQVMLQNHIIYYLSGFTVFVIPFFVIQLFWTEGRLGNSHEYFLFVFIIYQLIITIWFSVFLTHWNFKKEEFLKNYEDEIPIIISQNNYQSSYQRNLINNNVNYIQQDTTLQTKFKSMLGNLIMLAILSVELGIFTGMRQLTFKLTQTMEITKIEFYSLNFHIQEFIPVCIFFSGNAILYQLLLKMFIQKLVKFQNFPNQHIEIRKIQTKNHLFCIGLELIAPIEIMFIEGFQQNTCYNSSCFEAYDSYVNCRLWVYIILTLIKLSWVIYKYLKIRFTQIIQNEINIDATFQQKQNLKFIIRQYKKKNYKLSNTSEMKILMSVALFSLTQPISIFILLFDQLLRFYAERFQIINVFRRPINKIPILFQDFLLQMCVYVYFVTSSFQLFFLFDELQYKTDYYITLLTNNITPSRVQNLDIISVIFYLIFLILIKYCLGMIKPKNELQKRIKDKLIQSLYLIQQAVDIELSPTEPIYKIGRLF